MDETATTTPLEQLQAILDQARARSRGAIGGSVFEFMTDELRALFYDLTPDELAEFAAEVAPLEAAGDPTACNLARGIKDVLYNRQVAQEERDRREKLRAENAARR